MQEKFLECRSPFVHAIGSFLESGGFQGKAAQERLPSQLSQEDSAVPPSFEDDGLPSLTLRGLLCAQFASRKEMSASTME